MMITNNRGTISSSAATLTVQVPAVTGSYALSCVGSSGGACDVDSANYLVTCYCGDGQGNLVLNNLFNYSNCQDSSLTNQFGVLVCGP